MNELSSTGLVSLTILLSSLPVFIWGMIFLCKSDEKKHIILRTFLLGALMVVPLIAYRSLWELFPSISLVDNLRPLAQFSVTGIALNLLVLYASIGMIEEFVKSRVVNNIEKEEINSVKDAIEFSIITALGFAFAENTFYFIQIYHTFGVDMLLQVFVFRSLFSTFAHILFSAMYGYHFGLSLFAKEILKSNKQEYSKKAVQSFAFKQKLTGLLYAVILHAFFNLMLELGITMFLIPFLMVGVMHVSLMIYNKKNDIQHLPEN